MLPAACVFAPPAPPPQVPDEYRPPEAQKHSTHDQLHSWLLDRRGRDQFFVRFGTRAQVCWNWAQRKEAEVAYQRDFWADLFLDWSPLGNMIATAHRQGVAVWGGPDFTRLQRFEHPGAQYIQFSRGENYLATMSVVESKRGSKISLKVFNTRTAKLLRLFEGPEEDILPLGLREWPVLQWSGGIDDKYVAKISPAGDAVQVRGAGMRGCGRRRWHDRGWRERRERACMQGVPVTACVAR